jgi:hypothetical protein
MAKSKCTAEEVVTVLRQIEVSIATGNAYTAPCRESGIAEQA